MHYKLRQSVLAKIGKKINKLTIISYDRKTHKYECLCDCGNKTHVKGSRLNAGQQSCSCFSKNVGKRLAHGHYQGEGVAATRDIMRNYQQGAKHRQYPFTLEYEYFLNLIKKPCQYCGIEFSMEWKSNRKIVQEKPFKYNGVDRVDNTKGYTKDNCVPCCSQCNFAKSKLTKEQWEQWINRLTKYFPIFFS